MMSPIGMSRSASASRSYTLYAVWIAGVSSSRSPITITYPTQSCFASRTFFGTVSLRSSIPHRMFERRRIVATSSARARCFALTVTSRTCSGFSHSGSTPRFPSFSIRTAVSSTMNRYRSIDPSTAVWRMSGCAFFPASSRYVIPNRSAFPTSICTVAISRPCPSWSPIMYSMFTVQ